MKLKNMKNRLWIWVVAIVAFGILAFVFANASKNETPTYSGYTEIIEAAPASFQLEGSASANDPKIEMVAGPHLLEIRSDGSVLASFVEGDGRFHIEIESETEYEIVTDETIFWSGTGAEMLQNEFFNVCYINHLGSWFCWLNLQSFGFEFDRLPEDNLGYLFEVYNDLDAEFEFGFKVQVDGAIIGLPSSAGPGKTIGFTVPEESLMAIALISGEEREVLFDGNGAELLELMVNESCDSTLAVGTTVCTFVASDFQN